VEPLAIIINSIKVFIPAMIPIFIASLGELITERSGILNLGIDGIFVLGSALAFTLVVMTNNLFIALIAPALFGALIGLVHGFISITLMGNQVVNGLALTMVGYGLASIVGKLQLGKPLPSKLILPESIGLSACILLSVITWIILFKLKIGSMIRAVGENPHAAEALGVNVYLVRYICTVTGSALISIGGALFLLEYMGFWTEGLGVGRGWIALAAVIVSGWNPILLLLVSMLFAYVEVNVWSFQLTYGVHASLLNMLPYIVALGVLSAFMSTPLRKRLKAPSALAKPYYREERTV